MSEFLEGFKGAVSAQSLGFVCGMIFWAALALAIVLGFVGLMLAIEDGRFPWKRGK